MADRNQFEWEAGEGEQPTACIMCEAMLPDAVDGALSPAEQRAFDKHVAGCVHCARELEEAQRGAAWLSMLKTQTPEPPANLLAKILAETTGTEASAAAVADPVAAPAFDGRVLGPDGGWAPVAPAAKPGWRDQVQVFRTRVLSMFALDNARVTFQPRLAMTAAMAFFSIALTLNLTGVKLSNLHASNFTPSGLRRSVADMSASATRSFQNMRVVYQVESRVSELRSDDAFSDRQPAASQTAPEDREPAQQNQPQQSTPSNNQNNDQKQPNPEPHGHSELMMPAPGRDARGSAFRKDI